jgi:hypothetical protein
MIAPVMSVPHEPPPKSSLPLVALILGFVALGRIKRG